MLKVGVVGMGSIFRAHLNAYKQMEEEGPAVIEACCDIRPEQMEVLKEKGVRAYTDVDEMFKQEQGKLDYIDICVPTFLHAEIAIKAMEAGFHVISEKPMARTTEQANAMIEASKRTGKQLMVAYCNRFLEAAGYVKSVIDSKELGNVRMAEFKRDDGGGDSMGWNNWFHDGELSGGVILDLHIHDVDLIRWMFGMPNAVSAAAASYITKGGYDTVSTNYFYDNNVYVHASSSWILQHNKFSSRVIRVSFDKGYIYMDRTPEHTIFVKVTEDGIVTDMTDKLTWNFYYNEIKYFCECLINGKPVERCLPEDSIDSVKIVMAEIESADKNGERIAL
ncbi:MAG: Gfo/Idh/MocA family oxidoreductase [Lachnospiraceae bacterium]|nr:Gfo/Idh/MocA family oxidoreductase [Lachnospiraceae bacterium]